MRDKDVYGVGGTDVSVRCSWLKELRCRLGWHGARVSQAVGNSCQIANYLVHSKV